MSFLVDFSITIRLMSKTPRQDLVSRLERASRVGFFKEFGVDLEDDEEVSYSLNRFDGTELKVEFSTPLFVKANLSLLDAIYSEYPGVMVSATAVWEDGFVSKYYNGEWMGME